MKKLLMLVAVVGGLTLVGTTGTAEAAWCGTRGCAPVYGRVCAPVCAPVYNRGCGPVVYNRGCGPVYGRGHGNFGNCHVYGGWGGRGARCW